MLDGKVDEQKLGRRRGESKIQHHPGWDFAVNAPKSVSIMALVAGDERVIAAHEKAVSVALSYLEEHATLRHRVDGNITHETTGRLIYARFTEHASRELDPHLHTHVVIMNMTNRGDGTPMSSLETRAMFSEQMVAGQVYRNDLAHRLKELGYGIDYDPRKGLFEIGDVPKELIKHMSQRAEQIEAHARENGLAGQAARRMSFYQTRGPKEKLALDALHGRWSARLGVHQDAIEGVQEAAEQKGERRLGIEPATAARAMLFGLRQAEGREAVNNLGKLLRISLAPMSAKYGWKTSAPSRRGMKPEPGCLKPASQLATKSTRAGALRVEPRGLNWRSRINSRSRSMMQSQSPPARNFKIWLAKMASTPSRLRRW
ncbi:MobF family relaxase [Sphingobium sp. GW456-12-10-14-TSB1]|uniref:MobF family relaxase n=1 Tax=Sphingobium sp. GW456-12-10-14-TSB1 TaxID=1987165 RepID=UPI0026AE7255